MKDDFGGFEIISGWKKEGNPVVSVIMSVYNGKNFIESCLKSILKQSFMDFELIVLDDASTDGSLEALLSFAQKDNRLILLKNMENIGLTRSLMRGIRLSRGDYIARQDVDDQSDMKRLARQMDFIPEYDFVCCRTKVNNRKVSPKWITAKFYRQIFPFKNPFIHGTYLMKKDLYEKSGGYDSDMRYAQDYDLMKRVLHLPKVKIKYLTEVLYYSRKDEECLSLRNKKEQSAFFENIKKRKVHH